MKILKSGYLTILMTAIGIYFLGLYRFYHWNIAFHAFFMGLAAASFVVSIIRQIQHKKSLRVDENDQEMKRSIESYAEQKNIQIWDMGIYLIETKTTSDKIDLTIKLLRPGCLIGKGGKNINELTAFLTNLFHKPIEIHLKQHDPFKSNQQGK